MTGDERTGEEASLHFRKMVEENREAYQRGIKLLAELIYKLVQENDPSLNVVARESLAVTKNEEIPG